jgi:hypothetical protein
MITLNVSVCKKVGTANYGSNGATCSFANVELDEQLLHDPPALAAKIRGWYALAELAVEEEIGRLGNGHAAGPAATARQPVAALAPPPAPTRPTRPPAPPPPAPEEFNHDQAEDDGDDDMPRTGAQLLGWACKQRGDCKAFIIGLGRTLKFTGKVVEWNDAQVRQAYQATKQMLRTM